MSWRFVRLLIDYLPLWVGLTLISMGLLFNMTISGDGFMLALLASGFIQVIGDIMKDRTLERVKETVLMDVTRIMDRDNMFEYLVQKAMSEGIDRVDAVKAVEEMYAKFKIDVSKQKKEQE